MKSTHKHKGTYHIIPLVMWYYGILCVEFMKSIDKHLWVSPPPSPSLPHYIYIITFKEKFVNSPFNIYNELLLLKIVSNIFENIYEELSALL